MLASALVAGFVVGLGLGGSWRRLTEIRVAWWPLFIAAVGLRLLAALPAPVEVARIIYVASLWILLVVAARNIRLPGAWLVSAGIAANALVVSLSGGLMPVSTDALAAAGTRAPDDVLHGLTATPPPLGDVIPIPLLGVYSIGDVFLALGVFILIVWTMRGA